MESGSSVPTPWSWLPSSRTAASASGRPIASPSITSRRESASTRRTTALGCAPCATRTPISPVRRAIA